MTGLENHLRESGFFESLRWGEECGDSSSCTTPAITPGPFSTAKRVDETGRPIFSQITAGVHWHATNYPAWMGIQQSKDAHLAPTPFEVVFHYHRENRAQPEPHDRFAAPFGVDHIARTIDYMRELLGFQFDASLSVFELLMSQLESRASRTSPKSALGSLHADYIGGKHANFRKWYFAVEMDKYDRENEIKAKTALKHDLESSYNDEVDEEEITLSEAEAIWAFRFGVATDQQRLEEVIIYLLCWTEANQVRFMPECLAFIVKCVREYYYSARNASDDDERSERSSVTQSKLPETFFLDHVITPLYDCYRSYNFSRTEHGNWIRREGDHKDFIGYDDMNQLFWYRSGLENVRIVSDSSENIPLVCLPQEQWYTALQEVDWSKVFFKTYRESRSWLHIVTNFSRIWILHATVFWFYTSFNSPSLYTVAYNYMNPTPPRNFVRWTIMSLGGLIGPIVTLTALIGELRFLPRSYPGAKPVISRAISVIIMFFALGTPAVCNLVFNDWSTSRDEYDLVPATVVAVVLFALAVVYTLYFSYQPLDQIFGGTGTGTSRRETDKAQRKYLANKYFTAKFPELNRNDWIVSWIMCLGVFVAKLLESYFFLTLSLRDPIRELDIMSLEDKCLGDKFLLGTLLCRAYPKIILVATILTDMALFFLDTYLWYVIFNTVISVCIAVSGGTSIWTPWRNVYSRLSHRISSKLLVSDTDATPGECCATALRVIWASIVGGMYDGHLINREQGSKLTRVDAATQEPSFFTMNEDGSTFTASAAAYRRISFFAQSLSTPMQPVMAVPEMPMFTVLVPHYKEKIILSLQETINTDSDSRVTTLEYLRNLYPVEWENFVYKEQLYREEATPVSLGSQRETQLNAIRNECFSRVGFSTWDPNDTNPTRLWASERSQTLYRTVRGFYNYSHAIKVLSYAESRLGNQEEQEFDEAFTRGLAELVSRKFRLLIAMQLYDSFTVDQLREVEALFNEFPNIVISFVTEDAATDSFYSCLIDSTCQLLDTGKRRPKFKIKLSGNPILGDGKSDNQNTALVFYRGEYIQLIDANQDNYLEECLKIRNVLMEFESDRTIPITQASNLTSLGDSEENLGSSLCEEYSAETSPVAIVGAREYVFSENIGVLGDVAAGKEQTFGTLFARTLAKIGGKLHYGHPDFLNGIFMTTRGGVSKGQRGLHLNEDIYAGMTATLRGGRIRHSEYYQCGKGRDLGFVSILNFTAKIGAGMGEQMLSREYFYMGSQLPFDRFISFYYAHPGFHLNNVFIMLSLEMLLVVTLWFASLASVSTLCSYDRRAAPTEPHRPAGCKNILPLLDWTRRCVVSIFLVFFISLCPLFFQEVNEKGFYQSVKRIFKHFCSLSMLFEIFVCRIYARSFWEDLNIGGAKYVATGRGFATARVPFYKLFSGYRPEITTGLKAICILTYASICLWHASYLWFWVTTFSLCTCPFLYNPHQFAFVDFFLDYQRLLRWFYEAVTPKETTKDGETATWSGMAKSNRNKLTGVKKRTTPLESSRPSFRNTLMSEIGSSFATTVILAIPYVYVDTQKTTRHQSQPETSPILRLIFTTILPLAVNCAIVFLGLIVSVFLHLLGIKKSGNYVAAVSRTLNVCVLIVSWWVQFILERQRITPTLLSAMTVASSHHMIETTLTVFLLQRQRDAKRTNDPWWTGNWRAAELGWKCPLIICEELMVKTTESLQFAYDFLACHFILAVQVPFLLVPFIDKIHSLFLLWLPPSVCANAARCIGVHRSRQRGKTARVICFVFTVVLGILVALVALPLYLPKSVVNRLADIIDDLIPWDVIK